ncbi:MAG TPA: DUF2683 domain-containing protein [Candidatus Altiarchaeales archaeon]|nr:DUF2683 domain-containing protein [Candidatus Altiarchaeales archaeon]
MVKAIIDISEEANRVLNIIKAKYNLQNKSQAINHMTHEYKLELLEPELKPEFIKQMKEIENEKTIRIRNFTSRYNL